MIVSKCPYHHSSGHQESAESQHNIRGIFQELQSGVQMIIDSPEKEQALFAYRIFQFGENIPELQLQLGLYLDGMREKPDIYKNLATEMGELFKKYGKHFFSQVEKNPIIRDRLLAGLETFHAFIKRAVVFTEKNENSPRAFPYKNATQFASTSIERARMMAAHPEINGWEFLFFDPDIDVSKLYLGFPISRPIYRCPVLYSGKFREIVDAYFQILCEVWDVSTDMPTQVDWSE